MLSNNNSQHVAESVALQNSDIDNPTMENSNAQDDSFLSMSPTYTQLKNQSEIVKLLKIPDYLSQFEYRLKGYHLNYDTQVLERKYDIVVDVKTKKKVKVYHQGMMNDEGADKFMNIIDAHCNNILTMSSFDEKIIARVFYDFNVAIIQFLFNNGINSGMSIGDFDIIWDEARSLVRACLYRARQGFDSDKRFLMTTQHRMENVSTIQGSGGGGGYGGRRGGNGYMGRFMNLVRGQGGE